MTVTLYEIYHCSILMGKDFFQILLQSLQKQDLREIKQVDRKTTMYKDHHAFLFFG